jgi:hypothetical protein
MRRLRIKLFLGSTLEEIQPQIDEFVDSKCPGNYIDLKLWKHGNVYQVALIYAELMVCNLCGAGPDEECDAGLHG